MAGVNTTQITNMDLTPAQREDPRSYNARTMACIGVVAKAAVDDSGEVFRFFRVHSSWVPKSLKVQNDAIASNADVDFGLYTIRGGAEVDDDILADGVSLVSANLGEVLYGSTALRAAAGQALWERLGLSADPHLWYDLAMTVNSTGANAGDVGVIAEFLVGS